MDKLFIKSFDLMCCRLNLLLKPIHNPIVLLLLPNLVYYLTNFVFDGAIFRMVRWPQDNGKIARANMARHLVMNIGTEMRSKVVPNQYSVKVHAWNIVHFNIAANVIAKIMENIGGCANGVQASDPTTRALNTSTNIWRKSWVPWLDCKDDSDLCTMVVVSILSDTMHLHCPSPSAVASLKCSPKLINVDEPPTWHLKNAKGWGAIPESPHLKLNIWLLRLVAFGRCPLFRNI